MLFGDTSLAHAFLYVAWVLTKNNSLHSNVNAICCRVAATLAASEGVPLIKADFVLEGGSVHTDGEGYALPSLYHFWDFLSHECL